MIYTSTLRGKAVDEARSCEDDFETKGTRPSKGQQEEFGYGKTFLQEGSELLSRIRRPRVSSRGGRSNTQSRGARETRHRQNRAAYRCEGRTQRKRRCVYGPSSAHGSQCSKRCAMRESMSLPF